MTTIRKSEFSKVFAVLAIVGMVALGFSFAVPQAQANSTVDVVCALVNCDAATRAALEAALGGGTSGSSFTFTRDLTVGSTGQDVMELQKFLNANGYAVAVSGVGSAGSETSYFGSLTAAALAKYQAAMGISPAVGYFGPITRSSVNSSTGSTGSGSTGSATLKGGAGDIDDVDFLSSYNNEEVGEDEEDVVVAGYEVEVTEGSDVEIRSLTLDFDYADSGADDDLDDYVTDVSVWFNGEEVARADASTFDDDNNYRRSVTLDSGVIIEAGETEDIMIAVSGVSNLDSANAGEKWNVGLISLRFEDAQGAILTYGAGTDMESTPDNDTTTDSDEREFSLETFATAADVELKVSDGDDDINDARVIEVDDTDDTDNVALFSFEIEVEGDSDVTIDDIPLLFTAVGADVDGIANAVMLEVDGEVIASENVPSSATTTSIILFDDIDWTIDAGDTVEVIVKADLNDLETGTFDAGDTLSVAFGESETDNSLFDAEDEEGEDLGDADKTGSADSDAHAFYATGIQVELVSVNESVTQVDTNSNDDSVLFTIKYSITAFGGDVWVSESPVGTVTPVATIATNGVGAIADDSVLYVLEKGSTPTLGSNVSAPDTYVTVQSDATDAGAADGIKIDEDGTVNFTLSVSHQNTTAGDGGQYRLSLGGISWEDAAAGADEFLYTFNLDDFQTDYVLVN